MPCGLCDLPLETCVTPKAKSFTHDMHMALEQTKKCLLAAQSRQKDKADKHRRDVDYLPGDSVLLCTKNLKIRGDDKTWARHKLLPRFIGPYIILEIINPVAMKLVLPSSTKIHPVFHVSMLKMYKVPVIDALAKSIPQPLDWLEGDPTFEAESILGHRFVKNGRKITLNYLIKWAGFDESHNSWELADVEHDAELVSQYKKLHPTITIVKPLYKKSRKKLSVAQLAEPVASQEQLPAQLITDVDTLMDSNETLPSQHISGNVRKSKRKRVPNRRLAD